MKKSFKIALALILVATLFTGCNGNGNKNKITKYDAEAASYKLDIDAGNEIKDISDLLYGIFFEDINFAADGGLYAEKVVNRSFEFTELAVDDQMYGWSIVGDNGKLDDVTAEVKVDDLDGCLNDNNTNYLCIKNDTTAPAGVQNKGFLEGMSIDKEEYNFSIYAKGLNGYSGTVTARLVADGKTVAVGETAPLTDKWQKYELELKSSKVADENVFLQVLIDNGEAAVDMVSLFPDDTFKDRENGVREDLGEMLAELQPKFLRFPGGCVIEGYDKETAYDWKASVGADKNGKPLEFNGKYGDVAARRQAVNVWTDINATDDEYPSFMSYGLGFYEFFCLSEDIGAVGVPVINSGLYCQGRGGKLVEINSKEFKAYLQDMLDLVEFCRGDESTVWGRVRADLGHSEPFELKYICVGNENWGENYYTRYNEFVKTFNKAKAENPSLYDGIELIYSAGPDDVAGADYLKSYEYAKDKMTDTDSSFAGATDQHYYNGADWFFKNVDYYDEVNYSRSTADMDKYHGGRINVFLGEYASWTNKMFSALAESAYMTGLERNGDIVRMATYAPLLSSVTARHWAPDLIWFNNSSAMGSVNYYTQMLFSQNQGTRLLDSALDGAFVGDRDFSGKIGVGTWATSAKFDNIKVVDNQTGETLYEDDFSSGSISKWQKDVEGDFKIKDGALVQTSTEPQTTDFGSVLYYGDNSWSNYTYTLDATKLEGEEGFFIPFLAGDGSRFYWNIGGWGNTLSALQRFDYGYKTGQLESTQKELVINDNQTYKLKIEVNGRSIKCYIDDVLYVNYGDGSGTQAEAYQVVSTDETGDVIIKLVNIMGEDKTFAVSIANADIASEADIYQVSAGDLTYENIFGSKEQEKMEHIKVNGASGSFNYTAPGYSATVIRLHKNAK